MRVVTIEKILEKYQEKVQRKLSYMGNSANNLEGLEKWCKYFNRFILLAQEQRAFSTAYLNISLKEIDKYCKNFSVRQLEGKHFNKLNLKLPYDVIHFISQSNLNLTFFRYIVEQQKFYQRSFILILESVEGLKFYEQICIEEGFTIGKVDCDVDIFYVHNSIDDIKENIL